VLPYRDFYYPLNVFMHILTLEEGGVRYLHYGFFNRPDEPIHDAQERSTEMLLARLPAPPARLLEAGIGLGTTLDRLTRLGYDIEGVTPDAQQIAMVRERYGEGVRAHCTRFEDFAPGSTYDAVLFQESAQYIASDALFAKARELAPRVIVLDEFASQPQEGSTLHDLAGFLAAATRHGFRLAEEVDVSAQAAPSITYFTDRFPRYADRIKHDLGLTDAHIAELIASGEKYRAAYDAGQYVYRVLVFEL
jgi:cyclopropane fatty-acyl-phospholipid synthase-like methyltransferase